MTLHLDKLAAYGVEIVHHFGGGTYAKEARIPAGVVLTQHTHPHDHLSVLAQGVALVEVDGQSQYFTGPCCINIKAGAPHKVEAKTPVVWFCIHATDDTDPETVDTSILSGACCG